MVISIGIDTRHYRYIYIYTTFAHSVNQCTVPILSCDFEERMAYLSVEQKQTLKSLYKFARKTIHLEANLEFLAKCLDRKFIPKSFRLKNSLPGNDEANQLRINNVCFEAIVDEKQKHSDNLTQARAELDRHKKDLFKVFFNDEVKVSSEVKRVEIHMKKIRAKRIKAHGIFLENGL